ncbi:hypothetical protein HYS84_00730 [Candidatus Saccharibacteria bacterium]|nr:hypothetical protein [Candidatus Saccharibacteria bacterium]
MRYNPNAYQRPNILERAVAITVGTVAVSAAGAVLFVGGNKLVDRTSGLDARIAAAPKEEKGKTGTPPDSGIVYRSFTFGPGKNSLSFPAAKFGSAQDPLEAAAIIDEYRTPDGETDYNVQNGETITFAVDTEKHKIIPPEQAPRLPPSAERP